MMDCDTTGIEPDIALVKYKQLAGGGMLKIVNQTVPTALRTLGYLEEEVESIVAYIANEDTIEGASDLKTEHLPVFDCAFQSANGTRSIPWKAHVYMMAAAQPFISGAISKTVNMPKESTADDIGNAYLEGWRLGLKALAVYRDGSKGAQPVSTKGETEKSEKPLSAPRRERLQDTRQSITHKFSIAGHEGYITVGLYPDGRPGELFITMAKEGSTIGGLMDCFGTAVSMSLQYGVPLEVYVNKFSHTRFEPMGHTKNPDIRIAKSIVDYIFRWLGIMFLPGYREAQKGMPPAPGEPPLPAVPSEPGETEPQSRPAATPPSGPNGTQGSAKPARPSAKSVGGSGNGSALAGGNGHHGPKPAVKAKGTAAGLSGMGAAAGVSGSAGPAVKARAAAAVATEPAPSFSSRSEQFASFQTDAPACDNCGAITVRNGNCYLCYNCGNSMGCS
jgi:ribonucleoside-diphosphate reductase alpha chain